MKKFIIAIAGLLAIIGLTACGENRTPQEPEELSAPLYVRADFWEATWGKVENATSYTVRVPSLDLEWTTEENSMLLFEYLEPDTCYEIQVKANGDGEGLTDSEWKSCEYETEPVTKGIYYHNQDDGTYIAVCPVNKVPENGEVVFPNEYKGKIVSAVYGEIDTEGADNSSGILSYPNLNRVKLPNQVASLNTAFYKSKIREIYLPDTVKEIVSSFDYITTLQTINFPEGLERISSSFSGCTGLKKVDLPDSLKEITVGSFSGSGLTEIDLPKNLEILYANVFNGTPWYNNQSSGAVYCDQYLLGYKGAMAANTVLDDLQPFEKIASYAFERRENLKGIVIPEGCKEIERYAFNLCNGLETVDFPESLVCIKEYAFRNCDSLSEVNFNEGLLVIENSAFSECEGLTRIDLPESLIEIGANAFKACGLTSIEIPEKITELKAYCFAECPLGVVILPSALKSLNVTAFVNCTGITLIIPGSVEIVRMNKTYYEGSSVLGGLPREETEEEHYKNDYDFYILYEGDQTKWNSVLGEFFSEYVPVYFYSESEPTEEGNFWRYVDGVPTVWE